MCSLCGKRPAAKGNTRCNVCIRAIEAIHKADKERRNGYHKAFRYAVWKGMGVAFVPNGKAGTFKVVALPQSVATSRFERGKRKGELSKLPKARTIDLDKFCHGYTREQVKKLKLAIKRAHYLLV